jgi:hypothetical protein
MPVASTQTTKQGGGDAQAGSSSSSQSTTQQATASKSQSESPRTTISRSTKRAATAVQIEEAAEQVSTQQQHASITLQFTVKLTGGVGTDRF